MSMRKFFGRKKKEDQENRDESPNKTENYEELINESSGDPQEQHAEAYDNMSFDANENENDYNLMQFSEDDDDVLYNQLNPDEMNNADEYYDEDPQDTYYETASFPEEPPEVPPHTPPMYDEPHIEDTPPPIELPAPKSPVVPASNSPVVLNVDDDVDVLVYPANTDDEEPHL
jgi:hypothetical protein